MTRLKANGARWRAPGDRANAWLTPAYILEPIRAAMGGSIGLDPCTEPDNPTRAERFYALPTDGLAQPWDAPTIYCNPPYGDAARPWARRCLEIGQARRSSVALLLPAYTDTEIGQALIAGADAVVFIAGRLDFGTVRPDGKPWRAHFGSMLVTWGLDVGDELGVTMRATAPRSTLALV